MGQGDASYFFTVGLDNVPQDDEVTTDLNDLTIRRHRCGHGLDDASGQCAT